MVIRLLPSTGKNRQVNVQQRRRRQASSPPDEWAKD